MKRPSLFAVSCAIGVIGIGTGIWLLRPGGAAGPCVIVRPTTYISELPEASGLALSRRTPGVLWSHNDSGNATVLFALDVAGALRGPIRVPVLTRDWEDVSSGRCPAGDCLYIADIGDNGFARSRIRIFRVPEPAPGEAETAQPEMFSAAYADGPHNAEALFVIGADLFIVTRDRTGGLYRATPPLDGSGELTFERIGELGVAAVSDAESSPDEQSVVVRTANEVIVYRTADIRRGGAVPSRLRIPVDGLKEPKGEGVALGSDGMLYLASEGRPWNRAGRFISLQCITDQPS